MVGDWVIIKGLKIKRNNVGKVLKYMRELRVHDNKLRRILIDMKDSDRLWKEITGRSSYGVMIEGIEQELASVEKEMEGLRKALEKMQSENGD